MRFAGLNFLKIYLRLQFEACWGVVIMTSSWQLEVRIEAKTIWDRKMNLHRVTLKF